MIIQVFIVTILYSLLISIIINIHLMTIHKYPKFINYNSISLHYLLEHDQMDIDKFLSN